MSAKPKTSLFYYVPVILVAVVVLVWVFRANFRSGEESGDKTPPPAEGKKSVATAAAADLRALAKDASIASKGKSLYQINCQSCHGASGQGDGPSAASINPKPRNYKTEKFKYGDDIVSIYNTLMKGSPGTSMPAFGLLPTEDLFAMAHYVRTLIPNPTPTTDDIVAKLPESQPAEGGSATAPQVAVAPKDTLSRIPIQLAMQRMAAPATPARSASHPNENLPGAAIYAQHCASCHGVRGEGMPQRVLSVAPYRYEYSTSLAASKAAWVHDRNKFAEIVVKGLPGRTMPGNGTLTSQQLTDLYNFVVSLGANP